MFIDGIAMRNKLIMRKVFQEIEVVEVDGIVFRLVGGFWFRSVELNSFESPTQGLEEKVATKCRFLADRKGEDSQKDLV